MSIIAPALHMIHSADLQETVGSKEFAMRAKRVIAPALLIALCLALLIKLPLAIADRSSAYEWFDPILEIREVLLTNFVREPDQEQMQRAMLGAIVDAVDDPHTVYVPPANEADFTKELRGTYVGIGAEVNILDDYLTIISPMDDSPALEAGVLAGDVVLEIEGESTFQRSVEDAIDLLVGEPGTPVSIRVRHLDSTEEDITIVRRHIQTRSIKGLRRNGEDWNYCIDEELGIGYIRVTQFLDATVDELQTALEQLRQNELNGVILDLRDNPGGSLFAAVQMADLFLDDGVIVSVRGRERSSERSWRASKGSDFDGFPIVVMINGSSASASEIVAGALQENGRARVVGTRSYGKGSVQEVRPLPFDRGTLKYTSAYYYLPSGRNINKLPDSTAWGVDPDPGLVRTETLDEYRERILARRAFEIIEDADAESAECVDSTWVLENLRDLQLAGAIDVIRAQILEMDIPQLSTDDAAGTAISEELLAAADRRRWLIERLGAVETEIRQLQDLGDEAGITPALPTDVDLTNSTIEIRDSAGAIVGTYRVESGDLALAMQAVRLEPILPPADPE